VTDERDAGGAAETGSIMQRVYQCEFEDGDAGGGVGVGEAASKMIS
jgi:hypothetical protein